MRRPGCRNERGTHVDEHRGVHGLMVVRRMRIGHEHGGQPDGAELCDRACTGPGQRHVGGRIGVVHALEERDCSHEVGCACRLQVGLDAGQVGSARLQQDAAAGAIAPPRGQPHCGSIQGRGALAATDDEQDLIVVGEGEGVGVRIGVAVGVGITIGVAVGVATEPPAPCQKERTDEKKVPSTTTSTTISTRTIIKSVRCFMLVYVPLKKIGVSRCLWTGRIIVREDQGRRWSSLKQGNALEG